MIKGSWLDVREVPVPPIGGAVHIPLSQLAHRVHELPSRIQTILIADCDPSAEQAKELLNQVGRKVELTKDFEFGEATPVRLWSPNAFLEECLGQVPAGRALDLACGSGRDAVFMASNGFHVTAVDHLGDALDLGKDLASKYLLDPDSVQWRWMDLQKPQALGVFDLVTCFYYLNRPLLAKIAAPGSYLILETFTSIHRQRFGKPKSEDLTLQPGELPQLIGDAKIIEYHEGWHEERHTARMFAQLR